MMLSLLLPGCSTVKFLVQAGKGQLMLLNRGVRIEEVMTDDRTDPSLRDLLGKIPHIRSFGEQQGLKPTSNYREYVQLEGDAVVHVVTVSEALRFQPEVFRFPLVGSFTYIGWFDRQDAEAFALPYRERGMDVDVRGAPAYSTLGWFSDPLLSSMIPRGSDGKILPDALPDLVNVFLHESVHATLYLNGQSTFNESLADFVADVLTERFFATQGPEERKMFERYQERRRRGVELRDRLASGFRELDTLYRSETPEAQKRVRKQEILEALQAATGIRRTINNATLIQFKTYDSSDQGFRELLDRCHGDLRVFLGVLSRLKAGDFERPQQEEFRGVLSRLQDRVGIQIKD